MAEGSKNILEWLKTFVEITEDKPILKLFLTIAKYVAIFGSTVWGWMVHHEHIGRFFTTLFHLSKHLK